MKFIDDILKDPITKKWSLAKVILTVGFVIASTVLIKMAYLHEPEISSSFVTYLAFISGHNLFSKFLDKKRDENHAS